MEDLSEKEQIDALRAWWSENGNFVIGGIVLGVVIIFGWNRWQASVANTEIAASTLFEQVMDAAARNNLDAAETATNELLADYGDTAYGAQVRLAMARIYMDNGRDQDAADVLTPLANDMAVGELSQVAALRLGRILLYQGKADDAIALVEDRIDSAFSARYNELLGDAYHATGRYAEAEVAYVAALNDNPLAPTIDPELIQLKINDLPEPGEAVAETPAEALPVDAAPEAAETAPAATDESEPPAATEESEPPAAEAADGEPEAR